MNREFRKQEDVASAQDNGSAVGPAGGSCWWVHMLVPFPLLNAQGIGLSREKVDVALTIPMFLLARPKHCAEAAH